MTFIYELDPFSLERQTGLKVYTTPLCRWSKQNCWTQFLSDSLIPFMILMLDDLLADIRNLMSQSENIK